MRAFPPNRWRVGLAAAVGVGTLAYLHGRTIMGWAYADVSAASAEFRQAVLTAGIFAAAVAAWSSSSISSPSVAHAPAGALRRGGPLTFSNLSFLWFAATAGFTLGLAPLTLSVALHKTYGSFDPATIGSGFACLAAYVAFGYLIGCLVPSYLAVPVALGMAYAVVFFTPTVLSPGFEFDVISGIEVPARVSLIRMAYFLACAAIAAISASAWLRVRTTTATRAAGLSVAVMIAPLALVAFVSDSYSGLLVVPDHARALCGQADGSLVCVHPARSELLQPLVGAVSSMNRSVGPIVFPPVEVYDATLTVPESNDARLTLHIQGQNSAWLRSARIDLAGRAAGLEMCFQTSNVGSPAADISSAVGAWILTTVGEPPQLLLNSPGARDEFEKLEQLGFDRARLAIERHIADIRQCRGDMIR
jgi:hypothetical protein